MRALERQLVLLDDSCITEDRVIGHVANVSYDGTSAYLVFHGSDYPSLLVTISQDFALYRDYLSYIDQERPILYFSGASLARIWIHPNVYHRITVERKDPKVAFIKPTIVEGEMIQLKDMELNLNYDNKIPK